MMPDTSFLVFAQVCLICQNLVHVCAHYGNSTVVVKPWTCWKSKFLGKKIWRNALALKRKKVQGIIGRMFILAVLS